MADCTFQPKIRTRNGSRKRGSKPSGQRRTDARWGDREMYGRLVRCMVGWGDVWSGAEMCGRVQRCVVGWGDGERSGLLGRWIITWIDNRPTWAQFGVILCAIIKEGLRNAMGINQSVEVILKRQYVTNVMHSCLKY